MHNPTKQPLQGKRHIIVSIIPNRGFLLNKSREMREGSMWYQGAIEEGAR